MPSCTRRSDQFRFQVIASHRPERAVGDEDKEIGLFAAENADEPKRPSEMDYSADVKNRGENNMGGLQSVECTMAARGTLRSCIPQVVASMEAPGGVEPPTNSLGNCCSIQLSYGATH
jgi:hypothetical protein